MLDSRLTPADKQRLANFDATLKDALAEARAGGSAEDVNILDEALAGDPLPLAEGFDAEGNWRCRTIKVGAKGDLLPLVVYADFRCRIVATAGGGLRFEKISGSQRTAGTLYPYDRDRLGYAGSAWYGYEKGPKPYGADPERDEVGLLVRVSRERLRLELPSPRYESQFDIIELRRP